MVYTAYKRVGIKKKRETNYKLWTQNKVNIKLTVFILKKVHECTHNVNKYRYSGHKKIIPMYTQVKNKHQIFDHGNIFTDLCPGS